MQAQNFDVTTHPHDAGHDRTRWKVYSCNSCGKCVLAAAREIGSGNWHVQSLYPDSKRINDDIPEKVARKLSQALETVHAPDASILMSASAVDEMLKVRKYKVGSLFARIELAAADHIITDAMKDWAHDIRLDANDQRHADELAKPADTELAHKCLDFALALAEYLFVLPERVNRGKAAAETDDKGHSKEL